VRLTPPVLPRAVLALALTVGLGACGADDSGGSGSRTGAPIAAPTEPASPDPAPTETGSPAPEPADGPALDTSAPEVLTTGLEVPWGLAFLPDGDALVGERDSARVLRVPATGGEPEEVTTLTAVRPRGEGGLLGLAVSPTFESDDLVYAYYTGADDNRIVRFTLSDPDSVEPVLTGIPKGVTHNGGRIAFGPDGLLYAGTGDAGDPSRSQDPGSLGGKVLRMAPDGTPVFGGRVLSRGHRNVQGLAFDDAGRVYAVEFGQNRFDEVNRVSQGTNGGWPDVEGAGDGGGRFLAPIVTWETSEASPSGAAVIGSDLWVAALRGQRLWRVPLDGSGGAGEPEALYEGDFGRLRTAERAPDGSLWVLTSNRDGRGDPVAADDRILRLPAS
jgi:glucose/arabinose dehydrogenase